MTGYQSKKAAASAKTIDKVNWADHEPNGRRAAAQDKLDSMKDEALKLAQQVMESLPGFRADIDNALDAIKEALAQPAQKPFTYYNPVRDAIRPFPVDGDIALYTAPPQREWVGLTAEEAAECWTTSATQTWKNFEAALKEKNT